jgi:hypothetical protein
MAEEEPFLNIGMLTKNTDLDSEKENQGPKEERKSK